MNHRHRLTTQASHPSKAHNRPGCQWPRTHRRTCSPAPSPPHPTCPTPTRRQTRPRSNPCRDPGNPRTSPRLPRTGQCANTRSRVKACRLRLTRSSRPTVQGRHCLPLKPCPRDRHRHRHRHRLGYRVRTWVWDRGQPRRRVPGRKCKCICRRVCRRGGRCPVMGAGGRRADMAGAAGGFKGVCVSRYVSLACVRARGENLPMHMHMAVFFFSFLFPK